MRTGLKPAESRTEPRLLPANFHYIRALSKSLSQCVTSLLTVVKFIFFDRPKYHHHLTTGGSGDRNSYPDVSAG